MFRLAAFTLVAALAAGAHFADATRSSAQSAMVFARAGDGEGGYAVNAFLPDDITVTTGTTVRWEFPWWEPHTVTFGAPASGAPQATPSGSDYTGAGFHTSELLFGPDKRYEVRFTTPGAYQLYCVVHTGMQGTVNVVAPGAVADSQVDLDARAKDDYDRELAALKAIAQTWINRPVERREFPDGSIEHTVYIAGETPRGDVQQFFPASISIGLGDTLRWRSVTVTPHTVTFGPFPEGVPRPGNRAVDTISKPFAEYTGSGYWNSGVMGIDWPGGHEFSMKFGVAGTFNYYCIPHVDQGMVGAVTVLESGSAPGPTPVSPQTGSGQAFGPSADKPSVLAAFVAGAIAVAAAVGVAVRRRCWLGGR